MNKKQLSVNKFLFLWLDSFTLIISKHGWVEGLLHVNCKVRMKRRFSFHLMDEKSLTSHGERTPKFITIINNNLDLLISLLINEKFHESLKNIYCICLSLCMSLYVFVRPSVFIIIIFPHIKLKINFQIQNIFIFILITWHYFPWVIFHINLSIQRETITK